MSRKKFSDKQLSGSFMEKIQQIKPIVLSILKENMDARDDDNILCTCVWQKQGATSELSYLKFQLKLIMGEFATPESITRSRRSLQEKFEILRGLNYADRHKAEELMRRQTKLEF